MPDPQKVEALIKSHLQQLQRDVKATKEAVNNEFLLVYKQMEKKYGSKVFDEFFSTTTVTMPDGRMATIAKGFLAVGLQVAKKHEATLAKAMMAGKKFTNEVEKLK